MVIVLSWGMGVESTAILLRWLREPNLLACGLDELIVIVSQTGDEYDDTRHLCETHILPLLRQQGIRLVQVARKGHLEADGIAVLSDSRSPDRMYIEGSHKLSDELRAAGTVPQFGGEHRCSLKFKVFVIETWLRDNLGCVSQDIDNPRLALAPKASTHSEVRHAFGYASDEPKRIAKSEAATQKRVAFGFALDEPARAAKSAAYDRPDRTAFYPLMEWGWTRRDCIDYLERELGVIWQKSACVYCPFNALGPEAIERHKRHPGQVADALHLELVSLTLNPRGVLYKKQSLHEATIASGNAEALAVYTRAMNARPWRIYRVRRLYEAHKDKDGMVSSHRKGLVLRSVEHASEELPIAAAKKLLVRKAEDLDIAVEEKRGIGYVYLRRVGTAFPAREEFLAAGPSGVEEKVRYGPGWFEERWQSRQATLFPEAA